MYCASHGQQPKELIEDKFLTTISRICTKGLAGGKKAPVAQTGLCSYLKKKCPDKSIFGREVIFVFVIFCYIAVLDALPSREGEHFLKEEVDVNTTVSSH